MEQEPYIPEEQKFQELGKLEARIKSVLQRSEKVSVTPLNKTGRMVRGIVSKRLIPI